MAWKSRVKIRHLFTVKEDHKSVQEVMNNIADILNKDRFFLDFNVGLFRKIPKDDDFFKSVEYANKLLDEMYNFADYQRIWIE